MEKKDEVVEKGTTVKEVEEKKVKPIITSRVLFVSVLDKIYIVCLLLILLSLTINNFKGNLSSLSYGFFGRVGKEILILIGMFILYLFMNWMYKCAVKTVLCLTESQVYKEKYIPFHRWEVTIPLNKITAVNTYKFFWIFRAVVIHQYKKLPMIFWTYSAQDFKDELTKLITKDKTGVENKYEDKDIVTKDMYKYVEYLGIGLACIIILIGIARFFGYITSPERKMYGTYVSDSKSFVLAKDGTCDISKLYGTTESCTWSYDSDKAEVEISYTYTSYYSLSVRNGSYTFDYDSKENTLTYSSTTYTKAN